MSAPYVLQGVVVLVEVHLAYWAVAVGLLDLLVVERDQLGPVVASAGVQQEPALGVHLVLADWTSQFGNWSVLDLCSGLMWCVLDFCNDLIWVVLDF